MRRVMGGRRIGVNAARCSPRHAAETPFIQLQRVERGKDLAGHYFVGAAARLPRMYCSMASSHACSCWGRRSDKPWRLSRGSSEKRYLAELRCIYNSANPIRQILIIGLVKRLATPPGRRGKWQAWLPKSQRCPPALADTRDSLRVRVAKCNLMCSEAFVGLARRYFNTEEKGGPRRTRRSIFGTSRR